MKILQTEALSCEGEETWVHGNSLINYMKMVEMDGLSGKIRSTILRYNWHYATSWVSEN